MITVMLSLLALLRFSLIKIQRVINCPAHPTPKSAHITPLLHDLHWLPISSRTEYKIALICFRVVSGTAPPYISELLHLYSPRSLRSAVDTRIFRVPRLGRRTSGERSFQQIGTVIWNSFLLSVRYLLHPLLLNKKLKPTILFCILIF